MLHARFARMIDAFRPADGPPPRSLLAFFAWCLRGTRKGLIVAAGSSALAGAADVVAAALLGMVVDSITNSAADGLWRDNLGIILLFAGFFLLLRPAISGLSTASSNVILAPNVLPLVLSRLHRWTM